MLFYDKDTIYLNKLNENEWLFLIRGEKNSKFGKIFGIFSTLNETQERNIAKNATTKVSKLSLVICL